MTNKLLSEALSYARRGWYVFPCREKPGNPFTRNGEIIKPTEKQPYVTNGLNDATIDEDQITAWWNKWSDAMIGVNAGKSGLFVIDIDKKHVNGLDTFMEWNINDTAGLHSMTPSGGMHIIFTGSGKSTTNATTGIDTRGEGGYFIAPPSRIIEGDFCGDYKMFDDWSRKPGSIPDGLMSKLFPDKTVEYVRGNFNPKDGEKRQLSRKTLNFVAVGALEGERNTNLFSALADFAGCGYTQTEAREIVHPVCVRIGLGDSEFEQVLNHAYSKPRTSSIPDIIQEKIAESGKRVAGRITFEEQILMEEVVIACLLIDNSLIPSVNDVLGFDDFQGLKNRIIYRAITRLYNTGAKADYIMVSNEISKETDKVSLNDISRLINEFYVNTDNVSIYSKIIKEKSSLRKIDALLSNKEKYMELGSLALTTNALEKDIANIAISGGAKSTTVLDGKQAVNMVAERTRQIASGEIGQLEIGFTIYDTQLGGLYPDELIVSAGRAGDGKSALSLSIANHVGITKGKGVLFFSLEMSTHETICRLICQMTGIPYRKVYRGQLTPKEWEIYDEASNRISKSKIYFDDGFGMTVPEIRSKIRKMTENNIELIVIDQLEQIRGYENQPLYVQLDKISYDIKALTKEFKIPIILNHQLNRAITDRKLKNPEPQLSDLNQAGEKPANQVWIISHNKDEHNKILQSKIKVLKNRNGATLEFPVVFVGERMLFSNPIREEDKYLFQSNEGHGDDSDPSPF